MDGDRLLGVRQVAWDETLDDHRAPGGTVFLSLYIVGINTGEGPTTFSPLDLAVTDGKGDDHDRAILATKRPTFGLCTVASGDSCEGWWTASIPDNSAARRNLVLRWQPRLFTDPLQTPIRP